MLSIIIVNYNVKYFLEQCLCSVQQAMQGIAGEIIVIDNCSTDGSMEYLQTLFPGVHFIANTENTGFSKANNQGWRMAKGDFILFLNPDTLLAEDSLQLSLAAMEAQPRAGALGIRMVDGSGRYLPESKRGVPTPMVSFYKLSGLTRLFPRSTVFARYYLGHLSPAQNQEVEVLAGAYMLVRKTVLEATGGFDERFFMYGEDVDLSYRILQLEYKNLYLADSTIIHFKGESTKKDARYVTLFYKAMALFAEKHYGPQPGLYSLLLQMAIRARAAVSIAWNLLTGAGLTKIKQAAPIIITGTAEEIKEVDTILKKNRYPRTSVQTAAPRESLLSLVPVYTHTEIIFCLGDLRYKEVINQLQELPPAVTTLFHAAGSRSIVGSSSKNASGDALGG